MSQSLLPFLLLCAINVTASPVKPGGGWTGEAVPGRFHAVTSKLPRKCAPVGPMLGGVLSSMGIDVGVGSEFDDHSSVSIAASDDPPLAASLTVELFVAVTVSNLLLSFVADIPKQRTSWLTESWKDCPDTAVRLNKLQALISANADSCGVESARRPSCNSQEFRETVYISLVLIGVAPSAVADAIGGDRLVINHMLDLHVLETASVVRSMIHKRLPAGVDSMEDFVPLLRRMWAGEVPGLAQALTAFANHQNGGTYPPDLALAALVAWGRGSGPISLRTSNIVTFLSTVKDRVWDRDEFADLVKAMEKGAGALDDPPTELGSILELPGRVFVELVKQGLVRAPTSAEERARQIAIDSNKRLAPDSPISDEERSRLVSATPLHGGGREYLKERLKAIGAYVLALVDITVRYGSIIPSRGDLRKLRAGERAVREWLTNVGTDERARIILDIPNYTGELTTLRRVLRLP